MTARTRTALATELEGTPQGQLARTLRKAKQAGRRTRLSRDTGPLESAYGGVIPRIFGRARTSGNLLWTSGLKRNSLAAQGAEGAVTGYTVSLAVALCGRPIVRVGRVWADGRLIRSDDGRLGVATQFRIYRGAEDQLPDSALLEAMGDNAPAYRGLAYVVFENLSLRTFRNRIPSLSFEVIASEPTSVLAEVASDIVRECGLTLEGPVPALPPVAGFIASPVVHTGEDAIAELAALEPFELRDSDAFGNLVFSAGSPGAPRAVQQRDLGASPGPDGTDAPPSVWHDQQNSGPVLISYVDADRDYQTAISRGVRARSIQGTAVELGTSAVMTATQAAAISESLFAKGHDERTSAISLPIAYAGWNAGEIISLPTSDDLWRVVEVSIEQHTVSWTIEGVDDSIRLAFTRYPNPSFGNSIADQGQTTVLALDIPLLPWEVNRAERILIGASYSGPNWQFADVYSGLSPEAGSFAGTLLRPLVQGTTQTVLAPGPSRRWDWANSVTVTLAVGTLTSTTVTDILQDTNLALVGNEIIQFIEVEAVSDRTYRLSGLVRGRFGTEETRFSHVPGEKFVLLQADALLPIILPPDSIGARIGVVASGPQDPPSSSSNRANLVYSGVALRPLTPVHVRAMRQADGQLVVTWVPTSSVLSSWSPVVEDPETDIHRFDIEIRLYSDLSTYRFVTQLPWLILTNSDQQGKDWSEFGVTIWQVADTRSGLPAVCRFQLT